MRSLTKCLAHHLRERLLLKAAGGEEGGAAMAQTEEAAAGLAREEEARLRRVAALTLRRLSQQRSRGLLDRARTQTVRVQVLRRPTGNYVLARMLIKDE